MPQRKQFLHPTPADPELERLLRESKDQGVTEEELREQRVSFAYGNAPASAGGITKESVRYASKHLRINA